MGDTLPSRLKLSRETEGTEIQVSILPTIY